ncbi:serine hydrolase [Citrobacter portucalensis]|uniref:serine hydrolase n=1 Tax=Citrobacter portucalensis TaxID=1639133 RepID=UPI00177D4FAD|nr:serine hydrolase [Citrobacter portucalensis]MBD9985207.1 serine hydrolase [Citrobacter portucalensis]MBE0033947.1 serine hydrolase [Citrobacter portucalensis]MBE0037903.1 serine hydrolase [Citrobacter portucalensis]MBE0042883.1 serine hydrolase [Citrobacter portucalensis]MBE0075655.1 serine hydrolase [Citrobacter portucalensis]
MNLKLKVFSACILLSMSVSATQVLAAASTNETTYLVNRGDPQLKVNGKYIDQIIAEVMAKNNLPGLSMAIVQAPYIPRSAGYGLATAANDELASTKTMWGIGPITQAFTAVAVMQLVEQGKLDLNTPVSVYLPGLPENWHNITILELMQHSSGIPDFRSFGYKQEQKYTPAQLVDLVKDKPLEFKNGTDINSSATDFILLGMAIEKVSGMSYVDFVNKYQIAPLGLQSTMFAKDMPTKAFLDRPTPDKQHNQHSKFKSEIDWINPVEPATGYVAAGDKLAPVSAIATDNLFAYGGLWSSAEDISKWDIGLAGSTLVKDKKLRDIIYSPAKLKNGKVVPAMAGWEFTRHPGFLEIKGTTGGFSAYLSRFTAGDELVCVTMLTNKEGVDMTQVARDIAEAYKIGLGSGLNSEKIKNQESKFSVDETVSRLKAILKSEGVPVFTEIDHEKNAEGAGMNLRPTKVLVFGNPKVGTKLMQDKQGVALDLPLRVSVWQDKIGRVWVGYENLDDVAKTYDLQDKQTIDKIDNFMTKLVSRAVDAYIQ